MDKKKVLQIATMAIVIIVAVAAMMYFQDKKKPAKPGLENKNATVSPGKIEQDKYSINITSAPTILRLSDSKTARILWEIAGPDKTISHTAIYYDYASHSGDLSKSTTAFLAGYKQFTSDYANNEEDIPKDFDANLAMDKVGTLYYRAHAIIDGKHYWTDEKSIKIVP